MAQPTQRKNIYMCSIAQKEREMDKEMERLIRESERYRVIIAIAKEHTYENQQCADIVAISQICKEEKDNEHND